MCHTKRVEGERPSQLKQQTQTMKYQVVDTFFNVDARGNHKPVAVGSLISAKVYQTLSHQKQAKCSPVPQTNTRMNWSKAEIRHLAKIYLKLVEIDGTIDMGSVYAQHQLAYPERGTNALNLEIAQIQHLDTFVPQKGMHDVSQTLVNVLHDLNPNRFTGESAKQTKFEAHLDALLAQVRA